VLRFGGFNVFRDGNLVLGGDPPSIAKEIAEKTEKLIMEGDFYRKSPAKLMGDLGTPHIAPEIPYP
jgi:hypothetical protein